uniref:Sulfotransferase domain-containing protein n=1 Tax=Bosea sp. NBC_00436 TaxID=2969620 RepID=A0A9E7ZNJ6_9HYPH
MKCQLISYPKSGRTWFRYMLVQLDQASNVHFHHDGFEFNDGRKPPLNFDAKTRLTHYADDDKIIYLRRDPRDVMVSLYHQVTGRFQDFFGYRGSISDFLRDPYFGAHHLARAQAMWQELAMMKGFLTITYEDCHRDPVAVLQRSLDYWGLSADRNAIERAVEASSLDKMRQIEDADTFAEPWLRKRNGAAKVRRGLVGGFRLELNEQDIKFLNEVFDCPA